MGRLTLWGINNYMPLFNQIILPDGLNRDDLLSCIMDRSGMLYPYHQEPPQLKLSIESWFRRRYSDFTKMYEAITAEYNPLHNYDRTETHDYKWQENGQDVNTRQASGTDNTVSRNSGSDTTTNQVSGDDKNVMSSNGKDVQTQNGDTTTSVSAYDSNAFQNREKVSPNLDTTTDYGRGQTDTTTYGRKDTNTAEYGGKNEQDVTYGRKDTDTTDYGRGHTDKGELRAFGNIGVTTSEQMLEQEMELRIKYDIYLIIAQLFEDYFLCQVY